MWKCQLLLCLVIWPKTFWIHPQLTRHCFNNLLIRPHLLIYLQNNLYLQVNFYSFLINLQFSCFYPYILRYLEFKLQKQRFLFHVHFNLISRHSSFCKYQDYMWSVCSKYFKLHLLREWGSVCGVVDHLLPNWGLSKIYILLCQYLPIFHTERSHLWLILAAFGIHATPTNLTSCI